MTEKIEGSLMIAMGIMGATMSVLSSEDMLSPFAVAFVSVVLIGCGFMYAQQGDKQCSKNLD
jgi:hypothetical protein